MNNRRWIALGIALFLILVSMGFRFATFVTSGFLDGIFEEVAEEVDSFHENVIIDGESTDQIVVLTVDGVIDNSGGAGGLLAAAGYNHQEFLSMVDYAATNDTVKAVLLNVNSPGGGVSESAQIHRALEELQNDFEKPIYVTMGDTAASGGYYIAAPAKRIFAEASTITGSIGVIMESINFTEFAEDLGVEFNTFTSGKHKDIMSSSRKMTEEEEDILQSMIDEMYDEFVDIIVDGRQMDEKTVRELADGRVYTGKQAKEVDLVDEVGTFDDALHALMIDYDLEAAEVVQYETDEGFFNPFKLTIQDMFQSKNSEIDMIMELLNKSNKPRAMYLY